MFTFLFGFFKGSNGDGSSGGNSEGSWSLFVRRTLITIAALATGTVFAVGGSGLFGNHKDVKFTEKKGSASNPSLGEGLPRNANKYGLPPSLNGGRFISPMSANFSSRWGGSSSASNSSSGIGQSSQFNPAPSSAGSPQSFSNSGGGGSAAQPSTSSSSSGYVPPSQSFSSRSPSSVSGAPLAAASDPAAGSADTNNGLASFGGGIPSGSSTALGSTPNTTASTATTSTAVPASSTGTSSILNPGTLTYTPNPAIYTVGALVSIVPSYTGGAPTLYAISPTTLPNGLTFNATTGVISGTTTMASAAQVFSITASNMAGSSTIASLSITVNNNVFNNTWTLNTANSANYSFDSSKIDFTASTSELTKLTFTDQTVGTAELNTGTLNNLVVDSVTNPAAPVLRIDMNTELDSTWTPNYSSIIGYWKMDNNWNDSVGTNNGTPAAGLGFSNTTVKIGSYSGSFTGNGTVFLPSITPVSYTKTAWVYLTGNSSNNILSGGSGNDTAFWFGGSGYCSGGPTPGQRLAAGHSGSWGMVCDTSDTPLNEWHHVAVTYDAPSTTMTLFRDGVQVSINTGAFPVTAPTDANIGGYSGGNNFTGNIDDVALWNVALTPASINAIYQHQVGKFSGTYKSRVINAPSLGQSWFNLTWVPTLPFMKELPDNSTATPVSETSANYSSQTSGLMTGIAGLWHLNEASGATSARDASGNSNDGLVTTSSSNFFGNSGILGTAATFDGSSYVTIPNSASLNPSTGLTLSAWVKTTFTGPNNEVLFKVDSAGGPPNYGNGYRIDINNGQADILVTGSGSTPYSAVAGATVADGNWHNIVGVFDSSVNSLIIYVDGINSGSTTTSGTQITTAGNLYLGNDVYGNIFTGSIQEVAVWSRPLNTTEVFELYRRGANRIKYQVRSCVDNTCSAAPVWLGPDGTSSTYFSELNNNSVQKDGGDAYGSDSVLATLPSMLFSNFTSLTIPLNQYFQYLITMESDGNGPTCTYGGVATACSPELVSVSASSNYYNSSAPTITSSTGVAFTALTGFSETLGAGSCASGTKYNLSKDNSAWYYWNGSAWAAANGTAAQANDAATINGQISTFPTQVGTGQLYFKAFLQSSGSSICQLGSVTASGNH